MIPSGISAIALKATTCRLQQNNNIDSLVSSMDAESRLELLSLMKEHGHTDYADIVYNYFSRNGVTKRSQTRFSDGYLPVFYTAYETDTACKEIEHHCLDFAKKSLESGYPLYYQHLVCEFEGRVYDFIPHKSSMTFLTEESPTGYAKCNQVAKDVLSKGLDAVVTPSARDKPNGKCLPVFTESSVTVIGSDGVCEFIYDSSLERISYKMK